MFAYDKGVIMKHQSESGLELAMFDLIKFNLCLNQNKHYG